MNRFDKSCIRGFFTLPAHLRETPNAFVETLHAKPFHSSLQGASSVTYKQKTFYIIWFDDPTSIEPESLIDLSFRDFTFYKMVPVVLIRKSIQS